MDDPELEHGVFTQALLEGLSGKANQKNGLIEMHQLASYTMDRVASLSKGRQHPWLSMPLSIISFPLAKP